MVCALPTLVHGSENLEQADYYGMWVSNRAPVAEENQTLTINSDLSSQFERKFKNTGNQSFIAHSASAEIKDDLLILSYRQSDEKLRYKLVLSGWKSRDTKVLYGTMFMYREGNQFNGVPESFRER